MVDVCVRGGGICVCAGGRGCDCWARDGMRRRQQHSAAGIGSLALYCLLTVTHTLEHGTPKGVLTTPRPRKKGEQQQRQEQEPSGPRIHVPRVREIRDYSANVAALQARGHPPTFAAEPGGALAVPYVRWHPPLPGLAAFADDGRPAEYDVDEADEAWIERANAGALGGAGGAGGLDGAGRGGLMAAARGLAAAVANRFRSSAGGSELPTPRVSEAGGGAPADSDAAGVLTVDAFERAVERLELLHFGAVGKWWSDVNDGAAAEAQPPAACFCCRRALCLFLAVLVLSAC